MNPITGEKAVTINGARYVLRFTWRALAEIESQYGDNPDLFSPEVLAGVAAAGFAARHPELTAERIMELSPPLAPLAKDVQQAMQWAYIGNTPVADKTEDVKKNPATGGRWRLIAELLRRVFRLLISGR